MEEKKQIRLLWITENYYPSRGGMAQSCDRITSGLRNAGIIVDIIHFTNRRKPFEPEVQQNGLYLACPMEEDTSHTFNRLWNYFSRPGFLKDYTHLVAFGGFLPIACGPVFSKWSGIPLVTMIRGNDFDHAIFAPRKQLLLKEALEKAVCNCVVSKDKAQKIGKTYENLNVVYTPNGISLEDWQPLKSDYYQAEQWKLQEVEEDKKVIGLFGHLKSKKGIAFFIEALKFSRKKDHLHLMIVGELDEAIQEKLVEEEISHTILPFLDRFELLSYYPACDAIAIPSFYDGMPNVLLEAGALGVPVLASNVDGMKDVLEKDFSDWLFHPGDIQGCAKVLVNFLQSTKVQLLESGKSLSNLIGREFTLEKEIANYLEIFRF
ncbi:glycosyltransferase family 4 protein [Flexithrix dorotheae]|uniref:glycosyltransferase family 4 protein n=1 Tax=Flexithrix dorotheae TaxID=70993 RepID=UPI00037E40C3|nr:glycosyltransferase family 4 protein [Flexithrix dorotheae]